SVCRHQDDHCRRVQLKDPVQPIKALLPAIGFFGEIHVQHNHVILLIVEQDGEQVGVGLCIYFFKVPPEEDLGGFQQIFIIIDKQYFTAIDFTHSCIFKSGDERRCYWQPVEDRSVRVDAADLLETKTTVPNHPFQTAYLIEQSPIFTCLMAYYAGATAIIPYLSTQPCLKIGISLQYFDRQRTKSFEIPFLAFFKSPL